MTVRVERIGSATLFLADSIESGIDLSGCDLLVADPPYNDWRHINYDFTNATVVAFTNHQNRADCERAINRKLRTEIIWHFPDGRWVSDSLPRQTHASILVYGETQTAAAGELQCKKSQRKGDSAIGKWKQPGRVYVPKDRAHIPSVITMPRNVSNAAGGFGKPVGLLEIILRWIGAQSVADPFMGSGTTGVAALRNRCTFIGIEKQKEQFDIACDRIAAEHNQPSLFSRTPQQSNQTGLFKDHQEGES